MTCFHGESVLSHPTSHFSGLAWEPGYPSMLMAYCASIPIKPELTANTITTLLHTGKKPGSPKHPVKARLWEGIPTDASHCSVRARQGKMANLRKGGSAAGFAQPTYHPRLCYQTLSPS